MEADAPNNLNKKRVKFRISLKFLRASIIKSARNSTIKLSGFLMRRVFTCEIVLANFRCAFLAI